MITQGFYFLNEEIFLLGNVEILQNKDHQCF